MCHQPKFIFMWDDRIGYILDLYGYDPEDEEEETQQAAIALAEKPVVPKKGECHDCGFGAGKRYCAKSGYPIGSRKAGIYCEPVAPGNPYVPISMR